MSLLSELLYFNGNINDQLCFSPIQIGTFTQHLECVQFYFLAV